MDFKYCSCKNNKIPPEELTATSSRHNTNSNILKQNSLHHQSRIPHEYPPGSYNSPRSSVRSQDSPRSFVRNENSQFSHDQVDRSSGIYENPERAHSRAEYPEYTESRQFDQHQSSTAYHPEEFASPSKQIEKTRSWTDRSIHKQQHSFDHRPEDNITLSPNYPSQIRNARHSRDHESANFGHHDSPSSDCSPRRSPRGSQEHYGRGGHAERKQSKRECPDRCYCESGYTEREVRELEHADDGCGSGHVDRHPSESGESCGTSQASFTRNSLDEQRRSCIIKFPAGTAVAARSQSCRCQSDGNLSGAPEPSGASCSCAVSSFGDNKPSERCCSCGAKLEEEDEHLCCKCGKKKKKKKKKKKDANEDDDRCCKCGKKKKKNSKDKDKKGEEGCCACDAKKKKKKKCCGCCGGKKEKDCACGETGMPKLEPRHHGPECVMEFNILEKHTKDCANKKPKSKNKDDHVGSYDVIGRVVYPVCAAVKASSNLNYPCMVPPKDGAGVRHSVPSVPYLPQALEENYSSGHDMHGIVDGPVLCSNPQCDWGPGGKKTACPTMSKPAKPPTCPSMSKPASKPKCPGAGVPEKLCKKCADHKKDGREKCENSKCESSSHNKKCPSHTAMYLKEKGSMEPAKNETELDRKVRKFNNLRKIIEDAEPAVAVSKSTKSFKSAPQSSESLLSEQSSSNTADMHYLYRRSPEEQ